MDFDVFLVFFLVLESDGMIIWEYPKNCLRLSRVSGPETMCKCQLAWGRINGPVTCIPMCFFFLFLFLN